MDPLGLVFLICLVLSDSNCQEEVKKDNEGKASSVILPPCGSCNTLVNSFLASHQSKPELGFDDIMAKTCSDVTRGENQCRANKVNWSTLLKAWHSKRNKDEDLKDWLCNQQLKLCCPQDHFGPQCEACSKVGTNGKICSGNGKCKGSGTRKGNGECQCDSGFAGDSCQTCSTSHYVSYQDEYKTLCSPCHQSCLGECTGAGPTKCLACKSGFVMHAESGCQDIDECKAGASKTSCLTSQFCLNLEGSFRCMNCDPACKKCHDEGPESCTECADGYLRTGNNRACTKDESGKVFSISNARYFTYGGLSIATVIIFQKSTLVAGTLGLVIALYISITEYYLQNMNGDLQPVLAG